MKNLTITTILLLFILCLTPHLHSQQTDGYILSGWTQSYTQGVGDKDFLLYRVDAAGNKVWRKNFGGAGDELGGHTTEIENGRFAVVGSSFGSFTGVNDTDVVVYLLDLSGRKQWRTHFGAGPNSITNSSWDEGLFIDRTTGDGFILCGDSDIQTLTTSTDPLFARLNGDGDVLWWHIRPTYQEPSSDLFSSIEQTTDGGYITTGRSNPSGPSDFIVYKLAPDGDVAWQKTYGGSGDDTSFTVRQTADGGYILAGDTTTYTHGDSDFLVYKLNAAGTKQWRKNYGGLLSESCRDLVLTGDGGYILAGGTTSYTHGGSDMLVYKIDAAGKKQWRKNYGGALIERSTAIKQTSDGGYILIGTSNTYTNGVSDFLVYKIDASGKKQWRKNYGGADREYCAGVAEIVQ